MTKLSDEQRRVLKRLRDRGAGTPKECRTGIRTFLALAKRDLIQVDTTFASVAYPSTSARAVITEAGLAAIFKLRRADAPRPQ